MAFVNEIIPQEDREKYSIDTLISTAYIFRWTVDRDADIWLCFVKHSGDPREPMVGDRNQDRWFFCWKNHLIDLWTELLTGEVGLNDSGRSVERLLSIDIPKAAEPHRSQILKDLETALNVYKLGRGYSSYTLTLDIPLELKKSR
ncbi:MAG: hypothetical protein LBU53_04220 [Zoogloeaceae bacterium]|jgi:hypothetical protein|nr:hypothetical protein [Zoogloeaceae bacterium]